MFFVQTMLFVAMLCAASERRCLGKLWATEMCSSEHSKEYMALLGQLTICYPLSDAKFGEMLSERRRKDSLVFLFFDSNGSSARLVGIGSFTAERKFSEGGVYKIHIEDIVVDEDGCRGKGHGKTIINFLKEEARRRFRNVYKFTLSCSAKNIIIYEKIGFHNEGGGMQQYTEEFSDRTRGRAPPSGSSEAQDVRRRNPVAADN